MRGADALHLAGPAGFVSEYRKRRRQAFAQAVALTQRYAAMAVQALAEAIADPGSPPAAKVQAATNLLRHATLIDRSQGAGGPHRVR